MALNTPMALYEGTTINSETTARHLRKYRSHNPLQRALLHRFHQKVHHWLEELQPRRILDFGCGEGLFWDAIGQFGPLPPITGLDLRVDAIEQARQRLPNHRFECIDLFDFDPGDEKFDLVVASETLEHLYQPEQYLQRLAKLSSRWILLSVPHEPFFRLANLLRGRDLARWGNHPEHVQQWSVRSFSQFVSNDLIIERLSTSFPFILLLGRPRLKRPGRSGSRSKLKTLAPATP